MFPWNLKFVFYSVFITRETSVTYWFSKIFTFSDSVTKFINISSASLHATFFHSYIIYGRLKLGIKEKKRVLYLFQNSDVKEQLTRKDKKE